MITGVCAFAGEDMSDGEGGEEDEDGEAGGAAGGDEDLEDDSIHLFEGHTCEAGCQGGLPRGWLSKPWGAAAAGALLHSAAARL